jgi:hypothetical protein
VTDEQREAETPGQACTAPLRTCQPMAGLNRTGLRSGLRAAASCGCCIEARQPKANDKTAVSEKSLMLKGTSRLVEEVQNVGDGRPEPGTEAWASVRERHLSQTTQREEAFDRARISSWLVLHTPLSPYARLRSGLRANRAVSRVGQIA